MLKIEGGTELNILVAETYFSAFQFCVDAQNQKTEIFNSQPRTGTELFKC
jgi:hypothetical protein